MLSLMNFWDEDIGTTSISHSCRRLQSGLTGPTKAKSRAIESMVYKSGRRSSVEDSEDFQVVIYSKTDDLLLLLR